MKSFSRIACIFAVAGGVIAADVTPKEAVKAAAKSLGDKPNYSWRSEVANASGGGGRGAGPTEGKAEKGGLTHLTLTRGENTTIAVLKGGKGAVKTEDGWKSGEELSADQDRQNPARFVGRMLQSFKAPALQAADLAEGAKELKKEGDAFAGDLTESAAKSLMSYGGNAEVRDAKGSVKFWLNEGTLAKYQFKVQGTISFNGNDREVDRTTTVQIREVGTTKLDVPDEAKKKLQ